MEPEALTVLLFFVVHTALTPFLLADNVKIAVGGLVLFLAAFAAFLQSGVHIIVYAHVVPGTATLIGAQSVLRGDGLTIQTGSFLGPLVIFANEGFISQVLAYRLFNHQFYSLSHNLLHFTAAAWMASFLLDHVYLRLCPSRVSSLRAARALYDPAVMVCLGVLMVGHQHDTTGIGEFFHDVWGACFVGMGVLHVLSTMVHSVLPRAAPLCLLARALHAWIWWFNGLWACLMGFWISLWGDGGRYANQKGSGRWTGAREVVWPAIHQDMPSAYEEGLALLGLTLWLSGTMTAMSIYRNHVREIRACTSGESGVYTRARVERGGLLNGHGDVEKMDVENDGPL